MIIAIVQARMSSSRLPGKVLTPILGEPMLFRQLERIRLANEIDTTLIATSAESSDDPIAAAAAERGQPCFRGDLHDVLDRFYQAAAGQPDTRHVIRLTGDCPLADPGLIDKVVQHHIAGGFDYTSNFLERRYPDGLDTEIMTLQTLHSAWQNASLPAHREHVTPYIYENCASYRLGSVVCEEDLAAERWTVDHAEDFEFVRRIFEILYPLQPAFGMADIRALLQAQPELTQINRKFRA